MKIPVRYFSIGILTAAIVILGFYIFADDKTRAVDDLSLDELIEKIEEKGYRAITNDDYISFSVYQDKQRDKENNNDKDDNDDRAGTEKEEHAALEEEQENLDDATETEAENEVKEVTFTVEQGFVSQNIAEILQKNAIIDDPQAFIQYLEDNNYSPRIQIGTFTVNSDMSLKEIAEIITTYPGN